MSSSMSMSMSMIIVIDRHLEPSSLSTQPPFAP